MFYRPKAVTGEEFRQFNAPTVLLLGQDRRNFRFGEKAEFPLYVSRYEQEPTQGARFCAGSCLPRMNVWRAGHRRVCRFPAAKSGSWRRSRSRSRGGRVRSSFAWWSGLKTSTASATNDWKLWCFPAERSSVGRISWSSAPNGSVASTLKQLPRRSGVLVTDRWEPGVLDRLAAGGRVLLLDPAAGVPHGHDALSTFRLGPGRPCRPRGDDLRSPAPGAEGHALRGLVRPAVLRPGPRRQGDSPGPDPREGRTHRSHDRHAPAADAQGALCSRRKVGPGRLLVSGFNFAAAVPAGDPAAAYCLDELIRYTMSDEFRPGASVAPEALRAALKPKGR